jgi:hypothetical protein
VAYLGVVVGAPRSLRSGSGQEEGDTTARVAAESQARRFYFYGRIRPLRRDLFTVSKHLFPDLVGKEVRRGAERF